MKCDMDCLNCSFSDCVNDSAVLSSLERKISKSVDKSVLSSRGFKYEPKLDLRLLNGVDPKEYKKAQRRYFDRKYRNSRPEYFRQKGRENYYLHKESRLQYSRSYYEENREEILNQKKTYYQEHRDEILAKRKESYQPKGERSVIDTPEAEAKRQRERERYQKNKEEINRKRRERRKQKNADNKN